MSQLVTAPSDRRFHHVTGTCSHEWASQYDMVTSPYNQFKDSIPTGCLTKS